LSGQGWFRRANSFAGGCCDPYPDEAGPVRVLVYAVVRDRAVVEAKRVLARLGLRLPHKIRPVS